ncbi:transposase [Domibacillus aminovorans]|uniref:transposase n=1 Tax=Domibacillus aminovorans TaxID=29332 RepID=UPI003D210DEF
MSKFSEEDKLLAVHSYLEGQESYRSIGKRMGIDHKSVVKWVALYQAQGEEGLVEKYTKYSIEFKMDVLNYLNDTGASHLEAAAYFHILSPSAIRVKVVGANEKVSLVSWGSWKCCAE